MKASFLDVVVKYLLQPLGIGLIVDKLLNVMVKVG
jgi:hypothetical protein